MNSKLLYNQIKAQLPPMEGVAVKVEDNKMNFYIDGRLEFYVRESGGVSYMPNCSDTDKVKKRVPSDQMLRSILTRTRHSTLTILQMTLPALRNKLFPQKKLITRIYNKAYDEPFLPYFFEQFSNNHTIAMSCPYLQINRHSHNNHISVFFKPFIAYMVIRKSPQYLRIEPI